MKELGRRVRREGKVYLAGGATAVLLGWRQATLDLDLAVDAEVDDVVLREIPRLKEELQINVELASPADFIPELPGWRERSLLICREGPLHFFHYDLYAQALAKIERGHAMDQVDVRELFRRKLVDRDKLQGLFEQIVPQLYRFPAIDLAGFQRAVERVLSEI
jgi:hypothetical protein